MQLGDTTNSVWSENQGGSVGDVIGATYDTSNGAIGFYVNGLPSSSKTNSNGGNVVYQQAGTGTGTMNFGQQPFAYATNNMDGTCVVPAANNTSQDWSAGSFTGTLSTPWSYAFNGNVDTFVSATEASVLTLSNPINISGKTVEIWGAANGGDLLINGISMSLGGSTNGSSSWVDNTSALSGQTEITTISITGSTNASLAGIRIDGQILVDSTLWNTSQQWSAALAEPSGGWLTANGVYYGPTEAFDGAIGSDDCAIPALAAVPITWTVPAGISSTKSEFLVLAAEITVNDVVKASPSSDVKQTVDIGALTAGDVVKITRGASIQPNLFSVTLDDKILVDKSLIEPHTYNTLTAPNTQALTLDSVSGQVVDVSSTAKTMDIFTLDDWSNAVGNVVEGTPGTGLTPDTTYRGRVKHTASDGTESEFSDVNRFKTSGGVPPEPPTPDFDYDASGLRFDKLRETYLSRPVSVGTDWTVSFWYKPAIAPSSTEYFTLLAYDGKQLYIYHKIRRICSKW